MKKNIQKDENIFGDFKLIALYLHPLSQGMRGRGGIGKKGKKKLVGELDGTKKRLPLQPGSEETDREDGNGSTAQRGGTRYTGCSLTRWHQERNKKRKQIFEHTGKAYGIRPG
jgi:hypothetical protein